MLFDRKNLKLYLVLVLALLISACTPIAPGIVPAPAQEGMETGVENPAMDGEEITLYVAPEKVECVGVGPMECLQVKYSEDGESTLFYTGIDGFVFVPGYNYELRVLRTKIANPPADGSSLAYTLLEVVGQEPAYNGIAVISLPDGSQCDFAGAGATLAFDGKRLNYTCSPAETLPFTGLLGDIVQDETGVLTVELATINRDDSGFVLDESSVMTILAAGVLLSDGTQCHFAGMGATLAFDGERLNYTCGDPSIGLLGPLVQGEAGQWTASQVRLARKDGSFVIAEREVVVIAAIQGAQMP